MNLSQYCMTPSSLISHIFDFPTVTMPLKDIYYLSNSSLFTLSLLLLWSLIFHMFYFFQKNIFKKNLNVFVTSHFHFHSFPLLFINEYSCLPWYLFIFKIGLMIFLWNWFHNIHTTTVITQYNVQVFHFHYQYKI